MRAVSTWTASVHLSNHADHPRYSSQVIGRARNEANLLDLRDELGPFRDRFLIADPDLIYLDGNSLGRMPRDVPNHLQQVLSEWSTGLVRGWHSWIDLPQRLGAKIAHIVGAQENEVIVCDSTSVNLFKLVIAGLANRPGAIVSDRDNFPSDLYVCEGAGALLGREFRMVEADELVNAIREDVALICVSHVQFRSGLLYSMKEITERAHAMGALILWDLSHSAGAIAVDLGEYNVDLAVGCTYKYLNGGPGSPAYLYVREDLQANYQGPIWGWFGRKQAFDFGLQYQPADGMSRYLAGTPPIISMAAMEPGLDLVLEAGIERIDQKAKAQTIFLTDLVIERLVPLGFELFSPLEPERRGSHVALAHAHAWQISSALIAEAKVIPDFRAPNVLRLGISPLYTTYLELVDAVERIEAVVVERRYEKYSPEYTGVT